MMDCGYCGEDLDEGDALRVVGWYLIHRHPCSHELRNQTVESLRLTSVLDARPTEPPPPVDALAWASAAPVPY